MEFILTSHFRQSQVDQQAPDVLKSPSKWEAHYANYLHDQSFLRQHLEKEASYFSPDKLAQLVRDDNAILEARALHQNIRLHQYCLAFATAEKFARHDFAAKWKDTTNIIRTLHYNNAVKAIARCYNTLHSYRLWCPEFTLENILKDDGQGFLDLVEQHLPFCVIQAQHTWIHIRNPIFDKAFKIANDFDTQEAYERDPKHSIYAAIVGIRTLYLAIALRQIIQSYFNMGDTVGPVMIMPIADRKALSSKLYGNNSFDNYDNKIWKCDGCDNQHTVSTKFSNCSRCHSIGRVVRYCSRECQITSWKRERYPHKIECGKHLTDILPQFKIPSPPSTRLPPPKASYKRSPSLLFQIDALEENRKTDYHFFMPDQQIAGIVMSTTRQRFEFRVTFALAAHSGNPYIIGILFSSLEKTAVRYEQFGRQRLVDQLKREFGIDPVAASQLGEEHAPPDMMDRSRMHWIFKQMQADGVWEGPVPSYIA